MTGIEVVSIISGALNVLGAVAGLFGWRRHKEVKEAAKRVEQTGEAIIQGVEACEKVVGSEEAKQVKRSIQAVAEAVGVEGFLHRWLVKLGLSKKR